MQTGYPKLERDAQQYQGLRCTCSVPYKATGVLASEEPDPVESEAMERDDQHSSMTYPPAPRTMMTLQTGACCTAKLCVLYVPEDERHCANRTHHRWSENSPRGALPVILDESGEGLSHHPVQEGAARYGVHHEEDV